MRSKIYTSLLLLIGVAGLAVTLLFRAQELAGDNEEFVPFGIIIRPSLMQKWVAKLNREDEPLVIPPTNLGADYVFEGKLNASWQAPRWLAADTKTLFVETRVNRVKLEGTIHNPVHPEKAFHFQSLQVEVKDVNIALWVFLEDLSNLRILADRSHLDLVAKAIHFISTPELEQSGLKDILELPETKKALLESILTQQEAFLVRQLKERFKGFVFNQSLQETSGTSFLWEKGPVVQNDFVTLELEDPSPAHQYISFLFFPFRPNAVLATQESLSLYMNAGIFTAKHLETRTGLDPMKAGLAPVLQSLNAYYQDPSHWPQPDFSVTAPSRSDADLSFVFPFTLVNKGFNTGYREGILQMRAIMNIGKQTKDLIAGQELNVSLVVQLNPRSAPQILFNPDGFSLNIQDYIVNIGTDIEDRIIPATKISSASSVPARFEVDKKNVSMHLKGEEFQIKLEDLKNRLHRPDLQILENLTAQWMRDFLERYPKFVIFPTVVETKNEALKIKAVRAENQTIVIDMDIIEHANE